MFYGQYVVLLSLNHHHDTVGDVRGVVLDDANGNGVQDPGELPLSGMTVFVDLNHDGQLTAGEPVTATAADGSWSFVRLPVGTYSVVHVLPADRIAAVGRPVIRSLTVGIGTVSVADFFTLIPVQGSVSGLVFNDQAADGIFNAGDAPLQGWQVFADLNNNTVYDTGEPEAFSAADGSYQLTGLSYGAVTIRQTALPGFTLTTYPSGAAIFLLNGEQLGVVKDIEEYGGPPLLNVEAKDGREILVPFARSICKEIDAGAKIIRVELPEGLTEL